MTLETKLDALWDSLPVNGGRQGIPQSEWNKHQRAEHNIQQYCSCMWATLDQDEANSRVLTYLNPDCKLHGTNPRDDLPPEIP